MWCAVRVWPAVALTRYGVTASAFYGAAPHKKFQLGSPKGLPSRSFFSEKTEAGAYKHKRIVFSITYGASVTLFVTL